MFLQNSAGIAYSFARDGVTNLAQETPGSLLQLKYNNALADALLKLEGQIGARGVLGDSEVLVFSDAVNFDSRKPEIKWKFFTDP